MPPAFCFSGDIQLKPETLLSNRFGPQDVLKMGRETPHEDEGIIAQLFSLPRVTRRLPGTVFVEVVTRLAIKT